MDVRTRGDEETLIIVAPRQRRDRLHLILDFWERKTQLELQCWIRPDVHGDPVADGWAGAVMRKPLEISETFHTDRQTDTARCRVACPRLKITFTKKSL